MLDLLVSLVLLPAVLLVEEGLPTLMLGEIQSLDRCVGELERPIVSTVQKAHDTVGPAELLEVKPRQVDEGIADQNGQRFWRICFVR